LVVDPIVSIQLGVPRASQPQFLVEASLNNLPQEAVDLVRERIAVLDGIEAKLIEAQTRLAANRLGEIELREDEPGQLEREYRRWAQRLADLLGVPLNIYSERFRFGGATAPLNLSVMH
jgi:hypothetical protein